MRGGYQISSLKIDLKGKKIKGELIDVDKSYL